MKKVLLREYYELCEGGVCQDLLTEEEKIYVKENTIGKREQESGPNGTTKHEEVV